MNAVRALGLWITHNKVRANGIALVLISWLALAGIPDLVIAGLGTIVGLILGTSVHNSVMDTKKVAETVREATSEAAGAVAEVLGPETVGEAGRLPQTTAEIAGRTAELAAEGALQAAGVSRKDRAA